MNLEKFISLFLILATDLNLHILLTIIKIGKKVLILGKIISCQIR